MKNAIIILFLSFIPIFTVAQAIEETVDKVFYSKTDTVYFKWSNSSEIFSDVLRIGKSISPGTNSQKGLLLTAYIGKDSLKIVADNYPFTKYTWVQVKTPKGDAKIKFRFNSVTNNFSNSYMNRNKDAYSFEIPEVYELVNIIWTLSPSGKRAKDLATGTQYYKKINEYFKPFLDHPIFKKLDFSENEYFSKYYSFRENSYMYTFQNDMIVHGDVYYYIMGDDWHSFTNLFSELLPLVQDFATKSNFQKFYKENRSYYNNSINKLKNLLPIKNMWNWLEKELPIRNYNTYRVIFSPLIKSSHSTQNYAKIVNLDSKEVYRECLMFVCGSERYNSQVRLTKEQKSGLISGIVFTEIDHNYVNPVSSKFRREINEIFKHDSIWAKKNRLTYKNPIQVFNEYMTHAVFCLWVKENYSNEDAKFIINERNNLNVNMRGFHKFKAFNQELLSLRSQYPNLTITQLYPYILTWCKTQI
jgi:hypothetical protein